MARWVSVILSVYKRPSSSVITSWVATIIAVHKHGHGNLTCSSKSFACTISSCSRFFAFSAYSGQQQNYKGTSLDGFVFAKIYTIHRQGAEESNLVLNLALCHERPVAQHPKRPLCTFSSLRSICWRSSLRRATSFLRITCVQCCCWRVRVERGPICAFNQRQNYNTGLHNYRPTLAWLHLRQLLIFFLD